MRPFTAFSPAHRGGHGSPLVCVHGFLDTWRVWDLILPALGRHHDVLALTLPGDAGGPPIGGEISASVLVDAVEHAMDDAGFGRAHLVGSSLGGYLALQLAVRGRAQSVVAIAPAGGWLSTDQSYRDLLGLQRLLRRQAKAAAPFADSILASWDGRRRATHLLTARNRPAHHRFHVSARGRRRLHAAMTATLTTTPAEDGERPEVREPP